MSKRLSAVNRKAGQSSMNRFTILLVAFKTKPAFVVGYLFIYINMLQKLQILM
jgi:hypothetical protein